MMRPPIFVSCVSSELGQARQTVSDALLRLRCDPVKQEVFDTEAGDLCQVLREKIDSCCGLIQLVGRAYGAEPPVETEFGRVSYTQFEYHYARSRGKRVWLILVEGDDLSDRPADQLDQPPRADHPNPLSHRRERQQLQERYRTTLQENSGLIYYTVRNTDQLISRVERLRRPIRRPHVQKLLAILGIFVILLLAGGAAALAFVGRAPAPAVVSDPERAPTPAVAIGPAAPGAPRIDRPLVNEVIDPSHATDIRTGTVEEAYDKLADFLAVQMRARQLDTVQCAGVIDATGQLSGQEVGIEMALLNRLRARGVQLRTGGSVPVLAGAYTVRPAEFPGLPGQKFSGVFLQMSLYDVDSKSLLGRYIAEIPEPLTAGSFLGIVMDDPGAGSSLIDRQEKVDQNGLTLPVVERGTLRAGKGSPYGLYLRKKNLNDLQPLQILYRRAWAEFDRDDEFVVGLVNRDNHDAAVILAMDGVNVLALGNTPTAQYVRVPAGETREVAGWYVLGENGRGNSDQFKVTDFARAVAVQRQRPGGLGIISAYFHRAWDPTAPASEENARETRGVPAYGIGRGETTPVLARLKDMQIGRQRAALHVRYTVPK